MKLNLMFNVDATGSMSRGIVQVKKIIETTCLMSKLLPDEIRIGLVAYRDYCSPKQQQIETIPLIDALKLQSLIQNTAILSVSGGGDYAEAFRTGQLKTIDCLKNDTEDATNMIFVLTDAPPHLECDTGSNPKKERLELGDRFHDDYIIELSRPYPTHFFITCSSQPLYEDIAQGSDGSLTEMNAFSDETSRTIMAILCQNLSYDDPSRALTLSKLFRNDETYQKMAFDVLDAATQNDPTCLRLNSVFGIIYREMCKLRNQSMRDVLVQRISSAISILRDPQMKTDMKEWIDSTYDCTAEINEIVSACSSEQCYILDGPELSRDDVLELTRGCSRATMKLGLKAIAQIRLADNGKGLPLDLSDPNLFRLLSHILCPGIMFGLRPSIVLALMCCRVKNLLADRAKRYLKNSRGHWFANDIPEYFSSEFLNLAAEFPEYLTSSELELIQSAQKVAAANFSTKNIVSVTVGWKHPHQALFGYKDTTRRRCQRCNQFRSGSLLVNGRCPLESICGLENKIPDSSTGAQCRTCHAIYEILEPHKLKCRPKCHNCRDPDRKIAVFGTSESIQLPRSECEECHNIFIGDLVDRRCGECQPTIPATYTYDKNVGEIFIEFPQFSQYIRSELKLPTWFDFNQSSSLFKSLKAADFSVIPESRNDEGPFVFPDRILNGSTIVTDIIRYATLSATNLPVCGLCDTSTTKIEKCINCFGIICTDCAQSWFGLLFPGKLFLPSHILCPFCKLRPAGSLLKRYNRQAMTVRNVTLDDLYFHGWCIECYNVKPALERVCGAGDLPELNEWRCEDCPILEVKRPTKQCPQCTIAIEKASGCNHIACSCGAHFCWECSFIGQTHDIYEHMWTTHGSIGL
jgi:hypothetical protein